jgi:hypothetical protein
VVLPEKCHEYRIENYGYVDLYQLQLTQLEYHYSICETRLPILSSLYSQQTLFCLCFCHIRWVNSFSKNCIKQEVPEQFLWLSAYNSTAPINKFWVLSKYVKGGFLQDQLVPIYTKGVGIEEDRYLLILYDEEVPRVFLSKPMVKEWINKQNQVTTTFTELLFHKS